MAQLSGVSAATVTRALQGHPRVRLSTRERVEDAARRLGYRPDHAARALVTGMTQTIGLLVPTIRDPYWAEVAAGIEPAAAQAGFSVLIASGYGDPVRAGQTLDVLLGNRVDGVIVTADAGVAEPRLAEATELPTVVVGLDPPVGELELAGARSAPIQSLLQAAERHRQATDLSQVGFDDLGAGRLAAQHLVELGHRRIAFLAGPPTLATVLRVGGVRDVLESAGLSLSGIFSGGDSVKQGHAAGLELLGAEHDFTAILTYNDLAATGLMRAARQLGVDVPGQLSVVGFDDVVLASLIEPALTTVRAPKQEVGARATELLLAQMNGEGEVTCEMLGGELVARDSTAPPPA
ncbi:MAG TPA: LacI family DNA-binding transcriptional regulator [Solirubrobacteraceae bacterium]|nr:LacI family DNA-binding transcriptional regulator [Solirubrobacteraceae bacterium]